MEILNLVINVIEGLSALTVVLLFFVKPFRKWFLSSKKKEKLQEERAQDDIEVKKCLLRNEILNFYYAHRVDSELYAHQYENLSYMYKAYKKLRGNSFVDKIWEEIQEWTILP